jgi:hypothetical protein
MAKKNLSEYKKKYNLWRHHAWAAASLISVIIAIRLFLEISGFKDIPNNIIIVIGFILVIYFFISLFFTYKYSSGLSAEQEVIRLESSSDDLEKAKIDAKLEKERLKLEKKKAKAEAKKAKKENKD